MEGATSLWTSFSAVTQRVSSQPPRFRIGVPAGTAPQIGAVRAITPTGATDLQLLAVDDLPTTSDNTENATPETAAELHLPTAVEGTVDATQTYWFRFEGKRHQRVAIEVLAARLGSALDPLLTLSDPTGKEVAHADDTTSFGGDCRLAAVLPRDGTYRISLRDASHHGGKGHHYRLRAGNFPVVDAVFPLGIMHGRSATLEALAATGERHTTTITAPRDGDHFWFGVRSPAADCSAFSSVLIGADEEIAEQEPNDTPPTANRASQPCAMNGRFANTGDRDWFRLSVAQGENLYVVPRHGTLGVRTRLYLRLFDADQQLLAEGAQAGAADGAIAYQGAVDGDVYLCVEELYRGGGPTHVYRLELRNARRDFDLAVDGGHFHAPYSGVFVTKVTATRHDYKGPIRLGVEGLTGAEVENNLIAADSGETTLRIRLPDTLVEGRLSSCRIVGRAVDGDTLVEDSRATAAHPTGFGQLFSNVEFPPRAWRETLAIHVGPPFPSFFDIATTPRRLWLRPGDDRLSFAIDAERFEGFTGAIALTLDGLPASLSATLKPVRSGQPRSVARLRGLGTLADGVYPLRLVASGTFKEQPQQVEMERKFLRVGAPLDVELEPPGPLVAGKKHTLRVNVRRFTDDTAPIAITLEGLPPGVRPVAPVEIDGTRRTATVELVVDPVDAEAAAHDPVAGHTLFATATTSMAPPERFELEPGSLGEQLTPAEIAERGILREAESFDRGNVSIDHESYGKDIGIISDPGGQKNFAEYDLELPIEGLYQVELRYAARTSRPGRLIVNGNVVKDDAIREVTGTWTPDSQTWFLEGLFVFRAGGNVLRIESEPLMSHIDKVLVARPAAMRHIEAQFDSWVVEGNGVTAGGLEGNMISVFASDNTVTGKWRVGLVEFDASELAGETIQSVHLELGVDGRSGPLATGPVHSLARLLPVGTDVRQLNSESYRNLVPEATAFEALGHYHIAAGESHAAGEFEPSLRSTAADVALLTDRLEAGAAKWLLALEAIEDGTKTARDWGADDTEPKGTQGGPLRPRLVVRLADGEERQRLPETFVAKSQPVILSIGEAAPETESSSQ